ncbi:S8 family peptidase [Lihuaxuella thermophila]|uniref:Subtilase family protein n=1 Tax=Lihuaxuella thermophila TaxID=1173111 RepID=A0A1H8B6Z0_9BACL|nr:S8 family serine peptidase [Lihuaxuella thermophila]SEM78691.1 Subtilase family protein [Lihuaxuella thermophila]
MRFWIFVWLAAAAVFVLPSSQAMPDPHPPEITAPDREWVVKWKGEPSFSFLETVQVIHRSSARSSRQEETLLVSVKEGINQEEWWNRWSRHAGIEYLHPNHKFETADQASEPTAGNWDEFYYLEQIRAVEAWKVFRNKHRSLPRRSGPVIVAVVDTGVDLGNPTLRPLLVPGVNVKNKSLPPQDHLGHGTQVAGVLAAVWGALTEKAPVGNGRIMPIKVMEDGNDGDVYFTAEGIREAVRRHADLIVLAQGGWTYSEAIADAVREAERAGTLVVAAGGNASYDLNGNLLHNRPLFYPAALPEVLGVGSVRMDGTHDPSSNSGDGLDVVAPGDFIATTGTSADMRIESGTSFAAPQAAGVAALVLQLHPEYSPSDLRNLICQTARKQKGEPRWDEEMGFGLLDAYRALTIPLSPDLSEPNNRPELAMPVSLNQPVDALLSCSDRDWYQLDLEQPGTLVLQLHKLKGDWKHSSIRIEIMSEGRSAVYPLKEREQIKVTAPPGRVRVQLLGAGRMKEVYYRLSATWMPLGDSYENNDYEWNMADLQLPVDATLYEGTIHKKGDFDWFRLVLPREGELSIRVTSATPRMDPLLLILMEGDSKGVLIDAGGEGEPEQARIRVKSGSVCLRLSDYGRNVIDAPYQLLLHYQPAGPVKKDEQTMASWK